MIKNKLIELKAKTEKEIKDLVQKFMDETGILVTGINYNSVIYKNNNEEVNNIAITEISLETKMVRWKRNEA